MNRIVLMGRLGRDPESRSTNGGSVVVNLNLATDETWTDKKGERQKKTSWHRIVCFGKTGEVAEKHLGKGQRVLVEGRLTYNEWTDKEGQKRTTAEVVADRLEIVDWREKQGEPRGGSTGGGGGYLPPPSDDDDVPW